LLLFKLNSGFRVQNPIPWKLHSTGALLGIFFALLNIVRADDPRITFWLTLPTGQYARVYLTDTDRTNGTSVTTWSRNSLSQSLPVYSGVREVYSSANWVYLRTAGLGVHTMMDVLPRWRRSRRTTPLASNEAPPSIPTWPSIPTAGCR